MSFHYAKDSWRVGTVRGIGNIEEQPLLTHNAWEEVEKGGAAAIQKWIDAEMAGKSCQVVLIGSQTAGRKWVNYEIKKAWADGKGVLGVHIHNLKDKEGLQSPKGRNPFSDFNVGSVGMDSLVKVYDPPHSDSQKAYNHIADNLGDWIETAINDRK